MSKQLPDVDLKRLGMLMVVTVAIASFAPPPLAAQFDQRLEADPNVPRKDGFDTDRAIFWAQPNFIPLRDPEWKSLRAARRSGEVTDQTTVVSFQIQGKTLSLVSSQMSYHHVAQGKMEGEPWMITF